MFQAMDINPGREVRIYNIAHLDFSERYWGTHLDTLFNNVWTNPEKVFQEFGTLDYPDECENHHLAVDRVAEFFFFLPNKEILLPK